MTEQRTIKIGDRVIYCYEDGSVEFLSKARNRLKQPLIRTMGSTDSRYKQIKIEGRHYKVHRLIATAFLPNPNNLPEVDHINRNKEDNRPINLRWCDSKSNNNNKDRIDQSFARYGVRQCDDPKAYDKSYRNKHVFLSMKKPDGKHTRKAFLSEQDQDYKLMKPLSLKERYLYVHQLKGV